MASFALKVKTKSGQQILNNLTPNSTVKELKETLSNLSSIPIPRLHVLSGYPPKIFKFPEDSTFLVSCGISSGDTLILEEKPESEVPSAKNTSPPDVVAEAYQEQLTNCQGILLKQIVPADNSCLFSSIHFVLNGKVDEAGAAAPYLRQLIAETIKSDQITYSEAILGKPNADYCVWIQDDKSWGGAIELAILSNYYGMEIAVVDTINGIINRFGEDQNYPHRVFLMFDGIHYDPLYVEPLDGSKIRTIFPSEDSTILKEAEQLALEAKSSRQYTDVNKFTLKCLVCNIMLTGQVQAQQHAKTSGHDSFGEV